MKKRNELLDVVRGLAIVIVVFAHALQVCGGEFNHSLHDYIRQFQMPLLMAVSGFAATYGIGRAGLKDAILKKGGRLLLPYLCWAVIVFCGDLIMGLCSVGNVARYMLCSEFWFLRVLFIIASVALVGECLYQARVLRFINPVARIAMLLGLYFGCTYLISLLPGQVSVFHMSIWYVTGFAIAFVCKNMLWRIGVAICSLATIAYVVLNQMEPITAVRFLRTACGSLLVVLLAFALRASTSARTAFSQIGMNTLPVYAIHWCLCFNPKCFDWAKVVKIQGVINPMFVALLWLSVVYSLVLLFRRNRIAKVLLLGEK